MLRVPYNNQAKLKTETNKNIKMTNDWDNAMDKLKETGQIDTA